MEHKTFPSFVTKVDDEQGIVEHIIAVMGNTDLGDDVLHPGAFTKTLHERGHKVKVLDLHKTDSVMRVVGKPLDLREVGADGLPAQVKERFPEANGGLLARTQFLIDTPEGLGVFRRIKAGAVDEYSFGYDAVHPDYTKGKDGRTVRNLREVRLFEYGPVIFGMNPATATLSAKAGSPSESKPWNVFFEDGKYRVYKVDEAGDKIGESLGEHDTEDEARQQVEALYANEPAAGKAAMMKQEADGEHPASHYLVIEDPQKPSTWHLRVMGMDGKPDHGLMGAAWAALHGGYRGQKYEGPNKQEAIDKLMGMYRSEEMDLPKYLIHYPETMSVEEVALVKSKVDKWLTGEELSLAIPHGVSIDPFGIKAGRRMKGDMVTMLDQMAELLSQMRDWANYQDTPSPEDTAPAETQAAKNATAPQAGPATEPPTSKMLRLIEIEQEQIKLLEV